ncbi:MAG: hypothetical protein MR346_04195 [Clostridium sp.]|nr:hypothetical protein [Clostridium sp.]
MPPSNEYGAVLTIPPSGSKSSIVLYFKYGYKLINNEIIGGNEVEIPLRVYWVN